MTLDIKLTKYRKKAHAIRLTNIKKKLIMVIISVGLAVTFIIMSLYAILLIIGLIIGL